MYSLIRLLESYEISMSARRRDYESCAKGSRSIDKNRIVSDDARPPRHAGIDCGKGTDPGLRLHSAVEQGADEALVNEFGTHIQPSLRHQLSHASRRSASACSTVYGFCSVESNIASINQNAAGKVPQSIAELLRDYFRAGLCRLAIPKAMFTVICQKWQPRFA